MPEGTSQPDGRRRILRAAIRLFAEQGFSGVSISDVADEAGVVKSAIYHHFENKEALYLAALSETVRQSRALMAAAAKGETWRERLRQIALELGKLVQPRSHVLGLILEGIAHNPPRVDPANHTTETDLRKEFMSCIAQQVAAGIAAGELKAIDPELASLCIIGLVAAALQASSGDLDSNVDMAISLFLEGAALRPVPIPKRLQVGHTR